MRYWTLRYSPTKRPCREAEATAQLRADARARRRGSRSSATSRSAPSSAAASIRAGRRDDGGGGRGTRSRRSRSASTKPSSTSSGMRGSSPSASAPITTKRSSGPTPSPSCRSWSGTTTSRLPTRRRSRRYYLAEMTRRHVTVALNGDGGDESFARLRRATCASRLGAAAIASRCGRDRHWRVGHAHSRAARHARRANRLQRFLHAAADSGARRYARWMFHFDDAHERRSARRNSSPRRERASRRRATRRSSRRRATRICSTPRLPPMWTAICRTICWSKSISRPWPTGSKRDRRCSITS